MQWRYESSQTVEMPLVERLRSFPREPDMLIYSLRSAAALITRACLRVYHRFEIRGRENLPREGAFVMVANHSSHLDTLALLAALPLAKLHRAFPAAAREYFFVNLPRLAASAILVNAMPFSRQSHSRQSLGMCRALLGNPGNILILFPEGTRTTTGGIGEFRAGIGMLLAGSEVPVIPCALNGTYQAWPKGRSIPRPTKVVLTIGKPRTFGHLVADKSSYETVAANLRQAVQELLT